MKGHVKRKAGTIAILAAIAILGSCSNANQPDPCGTGAISVSISAPAGRALSNGEASTMSDSYEIVAYSPGDSTCTLYHAEVAFGNDSTLTLPVGSYSVVALAGKALDASTPAVALLGAASAFDVAVKEGEVTNVALTLSCLSVSLSAPDSVACGTAFALGYAIDFPIDELELQYPPQVYLSNHSPSAATYSGRSKDAQTGTITASYSVTAQAAAATVSVMVKEGTPSVKSYNNRDCSSANGFNYDWSAPGTATLAELAKDISLYQPSAITGINVSIGWGP